mmetsp:Transcript_23509/g.36193  ORF Transcript_23509/g.36193 Transcript_23509/m.36193 type:complete len:91 (-) Transcript_23509:1667-1939(-)
MKAEGTIFSTSLIIRSNIDPTSVKYYVQISSWADSSMAIQVNFSEPLLVSQGMEPDLLIVTIIQPLYFISASTLKPIPEDNLEVIIELPR